jgi:hypothetical protein
MAMALSEDLPLQTSLLMREVLVSVDETAHWALLAPALRQVVVILVRLGHHRPAVVLLGGSTVLPSAPDTQHAAPPATVALQQALGDQFPPLFEEGRRLTRHDLVRLALDEIDTYLNDPQAPGEADRTP